MEFDAVPGPPGAIEEDAFEIKDRGVDLRVQGQRAEAVREGLGHGGPPGEPLAPHDLPHHGVDRGADLIDLAMVTDVERIEADRTIGIGEVQKRHLGLTASGDAGQDRANQVAFWIQHQDAVTVADH